MISECPDSVNNGARPGRPSFRLSGTEQIAWGDQAGDSRPAPAVAGNKAEGRAKREAQPTALTIRSNPSATPTLPNRNTRRRLAFYLRSSHRGIIRDIHKPAALCGVAPRRGASGEPVTATLALGDDQASIGGLMHCSSPWCCPVCAPKLAAKRAAILGPQIAAKLRQGWTAWLITFTVSHGPTDNLADLFEAIGIAWSRVASGRFWQGLRDLGGLEYVRGYDVTWSRTNGHHPHIHAMVLLPPDHDDPHGVAASILRRWMDVCKRLGLTVRRQAQDVQRARDERQATAYAVTPAAVYEASAMAMKRARGKGAGLTPFEILERAVAERTARETEANGRGVDIQQLPQGFWEALWRKYVEATKGRRQVTTSRGLTLADDDLADDNQVEQLAELGSQTLRHLDRTGRTAELLEQAEQSAPDQMERLRRVETFLTAHVCRQTYVDCDWVILWPPGSAESARDRTIREERVKRQDAAIKDVATDSDRWFGSMREELKRTRGLKAFR